MRKLSLANCWHPIATIDEVGAQPLPCKLLGEELVAFRDEASVAVFRDVCVHRGAALSGGRVLLSPVMIADSHTPTRTAGCDAIIR